MSRRQYSSTDRLLINFDQMVRTVFGRPSTTGRPHPAGTGQPGPVTEELTDFERLRAARLMRVNHTGEVCAQALYQGQALTARLGEVRARMEQAAAEENDHLQWCEERVEELGQRTSVLNPVFYAGSFALGALAGAAGDRWSLGFVAETERQVVHHLEGHLARLPLKDKRSRAIVVQMKQDEGEHARHATAAGGAQLPLPIRLLMKASSKVMTRSTYWI